MLIIIWIFVYNSTLKLNGHMRLFLTLNFVFTIELCGDVIWSTFLSPQNKGTFVIYFLIYN